MNQVIQLQVFERTNLREQKFFKDKNALMEFLAMNYVLTDQELAALLAGEEITIDFQILRIK